MGVAVGVGGALIGGGAAYAGSKKQADAAKKGASTQLGMFNTLNAQQQSYIQSGYGATQKLNTLLGIGGGTPSGPAGGSSMVSGSGYRPTPNGGMQQVVAPGNYGAPSNATNLPLRHILSLRAQNGDTEAARVLREMA